MKSKLRALSVLPRAIAQPAVAETPAARQRASFPLGASQEQVGRSMRFLPRSGSPSGPGRINGRVEMTRAQKHTDLPHVVGLLHVAHVGGKPLRFFEVQKNGAATPWIVFDDFVICIGMTRQQRRWQIRKVQTAYHDQIVMHDGLTLLPLKFAEAIIEAGTESGRRAQNVGVEFLTAAAAAEAVRCEEVSA